MSEQQQLSTYMEYLEIKALLELEGSARQIALVLHKDGWEGNLSSLILASLKLAEDAK